MNIMITQLEPHEPIPYDLLLLADPSLEAVAGYIHRGRCYVARHQADVVGQYVLLHTNSHTIEIMNIAVKEEVQGQGVGTKLLHHAMGEARVLGATKLEIGTGNSSIPQLKLYQTCGFRITGIDHDYFIRNYKEEIFEHGIQCRDMIRLSKQL